MFRPFSRFNQAYEYKLLLYVRRSDFQRCLHMLKHGILPARTPQSWELLATHIIGCVTQYHARLQAFMLSGVIIIIPAVQFPGYRSMPAFVCRSGGSAGVSASGDENLALQRQPDRRHQTHRGRDPLSDVAVHAHATAQRATNGFPSLQSCYSLLSANLPCCSC